MPPRSRLLIPSATGGDEVPRRVVLAMAAMGLDDDEGTAFAVLAADPAHDRIHTPAPTAPERAQESLRLPSKRLPS